MRGKVLHRADGISDDYLHRNYAEFGQPYDFAHPPTSMDPASFEKLRLASPIRYAEQVRARVLLLVGLDDRRVPWQQSRAYYHALKSAATPCDVELLCFPGVGHHINSFDGDLIMFARTLALFDHDAQHARRPFSLLGV